MPARILIVGGGFVGLPAAKRIAHSLGKEAQVTLLDQREHFTFLPRLTDALEGHIGADHLMAAYAPLAKRHGFDFVQGTVLRVDRDAKQVAYADPAGKEQTLTYDHLIYCPGSVTNFYGTPGAEAHCLTLKSWEDVQAIHARVDSLIAQAKTADDARKRTLLSFVAVGAGPSGVEAVFALRRFVNSRLKESPELLPHVSYALIQAAPQILPGFAQRIVDGAAMHLHRRGVTVFVSEPVIRIEADLVETAHRRIIPAGLILWTAGIKPQDVPILPQTAEDPGHYLIVDSALQVDPTIHAAGDAVSYKEKQLTVPKNAQTAYLMSSCIAENAIRAVKGEKPARFHYVSRGTFLPLDDTGFIQFGPFVIQSGLAKRIRDFYYDKIHKDITS